MDILSGSYSRHDSDMAGLFQVLYGTDDGQFKQATPLNGTDGEPLIIPASKEDIVKKICTRPFAADLNGDGNLDLLVGNFAGTFYWFAGKGPGQFNPQPQQIQAGDEPLKVPHHSDPFVVDWDQDGDYDIVSGSSSGGVFVSTNKGSESEFEFGQFQPLLKPDTTDSVSKFGDEHITGPQTSTRVWVDDVNGDGKLDLLVGDTLSLRYPADGLEPEEIEEKEKEWNSRYQEIMKQYREISTAYQEALRNQAEEDAATSDADPDEQESTAEKEQVAEEGTSLDELKEEMTQVSQRMSKVYQSRNEFIREERTGFVWAYYGK